MLVYGVTLDVTRHKIQEPADVAGALQLVSKLTLTATQACLSQVHGHVVLGNVVISKSFLRTRKIMVMHSNERGECDLRTLVD